MTTVVVGGGVIGVTLAFELQRRGQQVTLVERGGIGLGASFGNMASIAVTEFLPASRPSVWRQMPGWLLDPEGPVRIRPGYMPRLLPWMLRFLGASRPSRLRQLEEQGAALCRRALADTQALMRDVGIPGDLTATGCLSLYANDAEFHADRDHIDLLDRFGFRYELLDGRALRDLEPELSPAIGRAVLFPDNRSVADPHRFVRQVFAAFTALGGRHVEAEVSDIDRSAAVQGVRLSDGRTLPCTQVALCAGAHTARLAARLGEPIPLETERGYHTQILKPGISLRHSVIWPARAFMVTPTAGGIRVGGTVEMAGLDAPPDYRRARVTVRRAREALPALCTEDATEWMGHRPALPDTVPLLSASARTGGLFYSTGHGHLGLTNAATSARLMAALMTGAHPDIPLHPYRIDRF